MSREGATARPPLEPCPSGGCPGSRGHVPMRVCPCDAPFGRSLRLSSHAVRSAASWNRERLKRPRSPRCSDVGVRPPQQVVAVWTAGSRLRSRAYLPIVLLPASGLADVLRNLSRRSGLAATFQNGGGSRIRRRLPRDRRTDSNSAGFSGSIAASSGLGPIVWGVRQAA